MFCRKCGAQSKPEAKFCKQCGNQVGAAQQRPSVSLPPAQQAAQRAPESRLTAPSEAAVLATTPLAAASASVLPVPEGPTRELSAPPPPEFTIAPPAAAVPPRAPERQPEPARSFSYSKASAPVAQAETSRSATIPPLPPPTSRVAYRSAISGTPAVRTARSPMIIILVMLVSIAAAAGGCYFLYTHFHPSDATIVANLKSKFDADASLHNATIGVTSQNGLVILVGYVGSDADNSNAIRIAGAEPGVKQVVAHLVTQDQFTSVVTGGPAGTNPPSIQEQNTGQTSPGDGDQSNQSVQTPMHAPQGEQSSPPAKALGARDSPPPFVQPTPIAPATRPAIVQAVIQQGSTSLQLAPGQMYIYGMVTGGAFPTSVFDSGDYAQATNAAGQLCAALAYGTNSQNSYTTQTDYHVIGGVSVSGTWDDMKAYYGSNSRAGASIVAAPFVVTKDSLVVVIASAASEKRAVLQGVPGLQIDATSSNGVLPMVIGHAYLPPGNYTASETSSAVSGQDPVHMADLIGVFVFGAQH
jgi:hypothetical protein